MLKHGTRSFECVLILNSNAARFSACLTGNRKVLSMRSVRQATGNVFSMSNISTPEKSFSISICSSSLTQNFLASKLNSVEWATSLLIHLCGWNCTRRYWKISLLPWHSIIQWALWAQSFFCLSLSIRGKAFRLCEARIANRLNCSTNRSSETAEHDIIKVEGTNSSVVCLVRSFTLKLSSLPIPPIFSSCLHGQEWNRENVQRRAI